MPKNSMLTRYKEGWRVRTDASSISTYGTKEGYVSVTGVEEPVGADASGDAVLSITSTPRVSVTADYVPLTDAEVPYLSYWPADTLTVPNESLVNTAYRVESITSTEDDEGVVEFKPELSTQQDNFIQRQTTWLDRVGSGTLNGRSSLATLAGGINIGVARGTVSTNEVTFSQGVLTVAASPSKPIQSPSRLVMVRAHLEVAGSSSTSFQIRRNGSPMTFNQQGVGNVSTFTLAAGVYDIIMTVASADHMLAPGENLIVYPIAVGTDAESISVVCTFADEF